MSCGVGYTLKSFNLDPNDNNNIVNNVNNMVNSAKDNINIVTGQQNPKNNYDKNDDKTNQQNKKMNEEKLIKLKSLYKSLPKYEILNNFLNKFIENYDLYGNSQAQSNRDNYNRAYRDNYNRDYRDNYSDNNDYTDNKNYEKFLKLYYYLQNYKNRDKNDYKNFLLQYLLKNKYQKNYEKKGGGAGGDDINKYFREFMNAQNNFKNEERIALYKRLAETNERRSKNKDDISKSNKQQHHNADTNQTISTTPNINSSATQTTPPVATTPNASQPTASQTTAPNAPTAIQTTAPTAIQTTEATNIKPNYTKEENIKVESEGEIMIRKHKENITLIDNAINSIGREIQDNLIFKDFVNNYKNIINNNFRKRHEQYEHNERYYRKYNYSNNNINLYQDISNDPEMIFLYDIKNLKTIDQLIEFLLNKLIGNGSSSKNTNFFNFFTKRGGKSKKNITKKNTTKKNTTKKYKKKS